VCIGRHAATEALAWIDGRIPSRIDSLTCPRCKKVVQIIVDYLCLECRAVVLGPSDDKETQPITITFSSKLTPTK